MPAHGCKLLRICAMEVESWIDTYHSSPPLLVGDTLHVTQGAELAEWRIVKGKSAPDTWQLRLQTLDLGRKAQGGLWLRLPGVPHWGTCNGERLSLDDQGDDIYRVSLAFTRQALVEIRG